MDQQQANRAQPDSLTGAVRPRRRPPANTVKADELSDWCDAACAEATEEAQATTTAFTVQDFTVAEAPWSGAEWTVVLRLDNPRATVLLSSAIVK